MLAIVLAISTTPVFSHSFNAVVYSKLGCSNLSKRHN